MSMHEHAEALRLLYGFTVTARNPDWSWIVTHTDDGVSCELKDDSFIVGFRLSFGQFQYSPLHVKFITQPAMELAINRVRSVMHAARNAMGE